MFNLCEEGARRIRREYLDLPGLSLSAGQMQRLSNVDAETCQLALDIMIRERFLRRTPQAQYVRCTTSSIAREPVSGLRSSAQSGDHADVTVQSR
jgi:hypothetical protein